MNTAPAIQLPMVPSRPWLVRIIGSKRVAMARPICPDMTSAAMDKAPKTARTHDPIRSPRRTSLAKAENMTDTDCRGTAVGETGPITMVSAKAPSTPTCRGTP